MLAPILRGLVRSPARRGAPAGASLAAQLAAAGEEAAREAIVLELVRNQVASVLGHDSAQAIAPEQAFTELGFDSLAAVELRNRLSEAVGVELAPTLAYDHPTLAAAATHVRIQIERGGEGAADRDGEAGPDRISIGSMLATARERGMATELIGLLAAAAAFRPKFDRPLGPEQAPAPVRLAEGPDEPSLICLSSIVPMSGPHEYAEIARALRGSREVLTLPQSGFVGGEPVPASREAAIATQVEAVKRLAPDRPFALLGHSSGGLFAHAVAAELEGEGMSPAGVVLVDTYEMSETSLPLMLEMLAQIIFATETMSGGLNDTRLTAMGAYLPLLADWEVPAIAAPTLMVRASDPIPGMPADGDWRASWQSRDAEVQVAGDHLTMMHEHAAATVAAIESWLAKTTGAGRSGDRTTQTSAR
jgi:thioesterase domain-containing protein/acyl carrier protein